MCFRSLSVAVVFVSISSEVRVSQKGMDITHVSTGAATGIAAGDRSNTDINEVEDEYIEGHGHGSTGTSVSTRGMSASQVQALIDSTERHLIYIIAYIHIPRRRGDKC